MRNRILPEQLCCRTAFQPWWRTETRPGRLSRQQGTPSGSDASGQSWTLRRSNTSMACSGGLSWTRVDPPILLKSGRQRFGSSSLATLRSPEVRSSARPLRCRVAPYLIKAAPAGAAGPAPASASGLGRPRPTRAGPTRCRSPLISQAHATTQPGLHWTVFPAIYCPAPGHRV
jgi:hypothetical protein